MKNLNFAEIFLIVWEIGFVISFILPWIETDGGRIDPREERKKYWLSELDKAMKEREHKLKEMESNDKQK